MPNLADEKSARRRAATVEDPVEGIALVIQQLPRYEKPLAYRSKGVVKMDATRRHIDFILVHPDIEVL